MDGSNQPCPPAAPARLALQAMLADASSGRPVHLSGVWTDLVAGQSKILSSFSSATRSYFLLARSRRPAEPARASGRRARSRLRDLHIVQAWFSIGSQKRVALELGISTSTVATATKRWLSFAGLSCLPSYVPPLLMMAGRSARMGRRSAPMRARPSSWSDDACYQVVSALRPDNQLSNLLPRAEYEVVRLFLEGSLAPGGRAAARLFSAHGRQSARDGLPPLRGVWSRGARDSPLGGGLPRGDQRRPRHPPATTGDAELDATPAQSGPAFGAGSLREQTLRLSRRQVRGALTRRRPGISAAPVGYVSSDDSTRRSPPRPRPLAAPRVREQHATMMTTAWAPARAAPSSSARNREFKLEGELGGQAGLAPGHAGRPRLDPGFEAEHPRRELRGRRQRPHRVARRDRARQHHGRRGLAHPPAERTRTRARPFRPRQAR